MTEVQSYSTIDDISHSAAAILFAAESGRTTDLWRVVPEQFIRPEGMPDPELRAACEACMNAFTGARQRSEEDLDAILQIDPSLHGDKSLACLSVAWRAVRCYRFAHELWIHGLSRAAMCVTNFARSWSAMDIHPGASIGGGLAVDHGHGLVIGETAIVGANCALYHGVTLGTFRRPASVAAAMRRHPRLLSGVTVYPGAYILGNVVIGTRTTIGAGAMVAVDVEKDVTIPAGAQLFSIDASPVLSQRKPDLRGDPC